MLWLTVLLNCPTSAFLKMSGLLKWNSRELLESVFSLLKDTDSPWAVSSCSLPTPNVDEFCYLFWAILRSSSHPNLEKSPRDNFFLTLTFYHIFWDQKTYLYWKCSQKREAGSCKQGELQRLFEIKANLMYSWYLMKYYSRICLFLEE